MKSFHHASSHLERAKKLTEDGSKESLLYAALELRYSLESRLLEYSEYADQQSSKKHAEWSAKKTSKNLKDTYGYEIEESDEYFVEISSPALETPIVVSYRPVTRQSLAPASAEGRNGQENGAPLCNRVSNGWKSLAC